MTLQAWLSLALYLAVLLALAYPLSMYVARMADPKPLTGFFGRFERTLYRAAGVDETADMRWTQYAVAVLLFSALGVLVLYGTQRLQAWLPLNPQKFAAVSPDSSFNSAISFVSNTDWQGYSGESTMSYATQMLSTPRHVAMSWARRLKRVFGVEIECCARCGGELKIIASIEEPQLIAKILSHLERAAPEQSQSELALGARGPPGQSSPL
jgi:K+-transporting ATPase ATPase A chain